MDAINRCTVKMDLHWRRVTVCWLSEAFETFWRYEKIATLEHLTSELHEPQPPAIKFTHQSSYTLILDEFRSLVAFSMYQGTSSQNLPVNGKQELYCVVFAKARFHSMRTI